MSKVVRKRNFKHIIMDWKKTKEKNQFFLNLDKYLSVEQLSCHGAGTALKAR